jgi:hypothetical protein
VQEARMQMRSAVTQTVSVAQSLVKKTIVSRKLEPGAVLVIVKSCMFQYVFGPMCYQCLLPNVAEVLKWILHRPRHRWFPKSLSQIDDQVTGKPITQQPCRLPDTNQVAPASFLKPIRLPLQKGSCFGEVNRAILGVTCRRPAPQGNTATLRQLHTMLHANAMSGHHTTKCSFVMRSAVAQTVSVAQSLLKKTIVSRKLEPGSALVNVKSCMFQYVFGPMRYHFFKCH